MRIHLEVIGLAAVLAAGTAQAQQQPPSQQEYPPQQQAAPPQAPPAQAAPAPAPPVQAAPAPAAAPSSSSSATSGGTPAGSQQVVVNPPGGVAAPPQQGSGTTVVNPPNSPTVVSTAPAQTYVERQPPRNPVATVALDAAYGGIAGALIGTGVTLVNSWSHWQRDIGVGAGIGLIAGAAVGIAHAAIEAGEGRRYAVQDGLGSPARDPVIRRPPMLAWSGRF